jgi:hypothetical protein
MSSSFGPQATKIASGHTGQPRVRSLLMCARHGFPRPGFWRRVESHRRAGQCQVGQRLREVARLLAAARVVLLGQQPEIVAEFQEPIGDPGCFLPAARQGYGIG